MEEAFRFICYGLGFAFAVTAAFLFWRTRQGLGRVIAALMAAWAAVCALLFSALFVASAGGQFGALPRGVLAAFLILGPVVLLAWWARQNGRGAA